MTTDLLDRLAALAQRDRAFTTSVIQLCREYALAYPNLRYYRVKDRTGGGEWDRTLRDSETDAWPQFLKSLELDASEQPVVLEDGNSPVENTSIFAGRGYIDYEETACRLTAAWRDVGFDDEDGRALASIWLFIGGGGSLPCQPGFAFPAHRFYAPGVSSPEAFLVARTGQLFQATAAALEHLLNMRLPVGDDAEDKTPQYDNVSAEQKGASTSGARKGKWHHAVDWCLPKLIESGWDGRALPSRSLCDEVAKQYVAKHPRAKHKPTGGNIREAIRSRRNRPRNEND